ncbi:MAG: TIGR03118 family protein [bacterium]
MQFCSSKIGRRAIALIVAAATLAACNDNTSTNVVPLQNSFTQTKLVGDDAGGGATSTDPLLVNPWGLAFGPTGVLWVSNQGSGTSTLYNADGSKNSLVVQIPTTSAPTGGEPTGVIFNSTTDFNIPGAGTALFIFAGEDGVISAWNQTTVNGRVVADRSSDDAVYKGIAIAANGGASQLYATNFKGATIDVFDASFQYVKSFTDPNIPAGYAPFGIQTIDGQLYVTYAKQKAPDNEDDEPGVGNGYVDVFRPDGSVVGRFASNGKLNAPWAIAKAPSGFGGLSGAILIGNFGDGLIGIYDPGSGAFVDVLRDAAGAPIAIEGLWGLTFGPGSTSTTLYYSAGPSDETHGLLGTLTPH